MYYPAEAIEEVVLNKRRYIYEEAIKKNPRNYDAAALARKCTS